MDKSLNRQKWIEALRRGDYTQGKYALKSKDAFCCLGVACDVYMKETGLGAWDKHGAFILENEEAAVTALPKSVTDWYGLDSEIGFYRTPEGKLTHLVFENDSLKTSFDEIADIIESEPKGFLEG